MQSTWMQKPVKVMPKNVYFEMPEKYDISEEQRKFYADNGYLVIKGLVDFPTLYGCKTRFIQICKGIVDKGNISVMKEVSLLQKGAKEEDLINKMQHLQSDDVFSTYIEHPRLLHVVSQFIGDNITAMHTMFINKPPGTGRHPPHQDLHYFPFRPADKIIAAWTAIDHVNLDNGCLYVVPGSHKEDSLHKHGQKEDAPKFYHGVMDEESLAPLDKRAHLEMSPGDTVFFHPLLIHGSGPNVSKNYRKAISSHYASSDCHYIDMSNEPAAKEFTEFVKSKNFDISFVDFYRYKGKQVKGVRSNL